MAGLRALLETETDNDSPGSEELVSQLRENIEALIILAFDTGVSGTATADPSNDANGYFYDTAGGWTNDLHNGRTLLITSGDAIGNMYTIDDTVDASDRLDCTGDNLYADGVRSGDSYKILYDLLVNTDGHDHDGVNSPAPVLADNYIDNVKLHTATSSATGNSTAGVNIDVAMHEYSFFPNIYGASPGNWTLRVYSASEANEAGRFAMSTSDNGSAYVVRWRYITATDEPFIYAIKDRATGEILHLWTGEDPPPGYWGLDKTPEKFVPPIVLTNPDGTPWLDPAKHEEIVYWKIDRKLHKELLAELEKDKDKACENVSKKFYFNGGKLTRKQEDL